MLLVSWVQASAFAQQAGNQSGPIKRFKPPDIYYPRGKKIKSKKLDLNTATFQELMLLPNVDEDLALKIIQRRPIESIQDLHRLPYMNIERMKRLTAEFVPFVVQPPEPTPDSLQQ